MKKFLAFSAAFMLLSAPAMAEITPYVSASVGVGSLGNSSMSALDRTVDDAITYKRGTPFSGAVGIEREKCRIEAAIAHQSNDVDKIKSDAINLASVSGYSISTTSYMLNGYYDVAIKKSSIVPYVMAGIGAASINAKSSDHSSGETGFAYQAGVGVGIKPCACGKMSVDLGYRYFKPSKSNIFNFNDVTISSSNLLLGFRYKL
ncbi:MAG: outer membrane beta-barrel protein [Chlorobiaceae bacterium]